MKKIYKSFFLLSLAVVAITSCEDENDYIPPFNDVSTLTWWVSPADTFNETTKDLRISDYIAFKDLSRGVISHEWRIPASARFLSKNIPETDTIYSKYILPNAGQVTTDDLALVLFTETGSQEVYLVNSFKDSVAESIKEDGVWKVNKKFTINVAE